MASETPQPAPAGQLPPWATLARAPNPGPMTLEGTNTWVLRAPGAGQAVVVDPGPRHEEHLARVAGHGPVELIIVTHGHPDHVEGLDRLRELCPATPVAELRDGAELRAAGLSIRGLATPGHTADSYSLLVSLPDGSAPAVLTGDTILGRGSAVVAWPDGDLGDYLASLRRLAGLGPVPALPGHGPALADCAAAARWYLAHRQERLVQVAAAVAAGADTPRLVVEAVYPQVPAELRFAAEWSARAQLDYLAAQSGDGRAAGTGGEADSRAGGGPVARDGDEPAAGTGGEAESNPADRESSRRPVWLDTP